MTSKLIAVLLLLAAPLAAQHVAASNQTDRTPVSPLQVWEEAVAAIRQAEGLHDALSNGEFDLNISADACLSIRTQQRGGRTPALPTPITALGDNEAECEVLLSEDYVKEALHGWQWDFPTPTGTEYDVCASGCDYTTLQDAIAAVPCNSIITVEAGYVTVLGSSEVAFDNANNHCSEDAPVWIRTSAHASLPPIGGRVDISDVSNMPKWTGSGTRMFTIDEAALSISSVNTGTDTLTTAADHGLSPGDEIYFSSDAPQPLDDTRPYWVLTVPTTTTLTVSRYENASAATLDITGTASGSITMPSSWIRFTGIYLEVEDGETTGNMFTGLDSPYAPGARTNHIWIDRSIIRGLPNQSSNSRCVQISGQEYAVTDSLVEFCGLAGTEGQAILLASDATGPVWVENNKLIGAGEHIMAGGSAGANRHLNPCEKGDCVVKGNHFDLPPQYYKRSIVAGAPTTPCVPGEWWQDSTGGPDYYTCDEDGLDWTSDPGTDFPLNFAYKNHYEIKKGFGFLNLGNVYENAWGDAQDGTIINIKQAAAAQNGVNVSFKNSLMYGEIVKHAAAFLQVAGFTGSGDTTANMPIQPGPAFVWNLLAFDIDADLYDYPTDAVASTKPFEIMNIPAGVFFDHITAVPGPSATTATNFRPSAGKAQINPFVLHSSILGVGDFKHDGVSAGCNSLGAVSATGDVDDSLWVWTDGAGPSMTGCATNFYDETDLDDVGFADWSGGTAPEDFRLSSAGATADYRAGGAQDAADGKDMGADTEIIADLTGGAEAGFLSWSERFGVAVTAVGSTTATVEWDRPNASNACNFYLYTNYARTAEHADTSGDNGDNRDGGVSAGHVTFELGANSALTANAWFWFEIDCPADSVKMVGSLFTN